MMNGGRRREGRSAGQKNNSSAGRAAAALLTSKALTILTCLSACASATSSYTSVKISASPPLSPWNDLDAQQPANVAVTNDADDAPAAASLSTTTALPTSYILSSFSSSSSVIGQQYLRTSLLNSNSWLCRQRRLRRIRGSEPPNLRQRIPSHLRSRSRDGHRDAGDSSSSSSRGTNTKDTQTAPYMQQLAKGEKATKCAAVTKISRGGSSYGQGGGGGSGAGGGGYGDDWYDDGYGGYDGYDDGHGGAAAYPSGGSAKGGKKSTGRAGGGGKGQGQYYEEEDYYYEEDYYEDGGPPRKSKRAGAGRTSGGISKKKKTGRGLVVGGIDITGTIANGNKKFGIIAIACSLALTFLGVSLFFNKTLMRLGNICFIAGCSLFIGPSRTIRYFSQRSKLRGTIIFMLGFLMVFTGHPIIGLVLEVFGFLNLFGNMLPMVGSMARNMPFVKDILGSTSGRGGGGSGGNSRNSGKRKQDRGSQPPPPRQYPPPDYYDDDYRYR